ncbi:hypothetical protein MRB53_040459 [Persea americana]|nr:hypothetical protein MRB53_040459 [Persea americana]
MMSRSFISALRNTSASLRNPSTQLTRSVRSARSFQTSARLQETPAAALPIRKPVGAFRGGILGFFMGSALAGAGTYYYVLEEYRISNELLTEDIYVGPSCLVSSMQLTKLQALQAAVQRIESYVRSLEDQIVKK